MFNSMGFIVCLSLFTALLSGCAGSPKPPLEVVHEVDLDRYMGKWHEIARYQHSFQEGCRQSTATYTRQADGSVSVVNECITLEKQKRAMAKAWVVDPNVPAKLKVRFFWPFTGDYWIIDLGHDYEYAVISAPSRKYLWILARSPALESSVLNDIKARLVAQGFDLEKLVYETDQP